MSEAMELIQAVTEMEERARLLPAGVEAMVGVATAYQAKVDAFVKGLEDKQTRVDALTTLVDTAMQALQTAASDERPILQGGIKQVDTAVEQARDGIKSALDDLADALDAAKKSVASLQSGLADAAERAESSESSAADALEGVRGQMTASDQNLDVHVSAAAAAADGVETEAADASEKVVGGLAQLATNLMEYAELHVGTRLDRASEAFTGFVQKHEGAMQTVAEALDGSAQELGKELQDEMADKVGERLSKLVEETGRAYDAMDKRHRDVGAEAVGEFEERTERGADLRSQGDDLLAGEVAAVKRGATKVGVDWPA